MCSGGVSESSRICLQSLKSRLCGGNRWLPSVTFAERLRGQVPIYIISISYNTPVSVGCKRKILNFVIVIRQCRTDKHIVKVFFASPFAKMWKFSFWMDDTEQHSLSYRYMWLGAFCISISHIYPSVEYFCLFLHRSFHNLHYNRREAPHFSYAVNCMRI